MKDSLPEEAVLMESLDYEKIKQAGVYAVNVNTIEDIDEIPTLTGYKNSWQYSIILPASF
ncbi:MAG: hypothetical protein Q4D16_13050 [Eubacteriales bacterium]|nr:hypothetical protein [Eubacteriales bacterium]